MACKHSVQFYGKNKRLLVENVAAFFAESLEDGGGAISIAAADRNAAIADTLETFVPGSSPRLFQLDAAATLQKFMIDGRPDPASFDRVVGQEVRKLHARFGLVRGYGEMVGMLWLARQASAAIALEEMWNALLRSIDFKLFCGYPIDVLSSEFQIAAVEPLIATHDVVVPGTHEEFHAALERAIDDVLGPRSGGVRLGSGYRTNASWPSMPETERTILWLRNKYPRHADEILQKAGRYHAG